MQEEKLNSHLDFIFKKENAAGTKLFIRSRSMALLIIALWIGIAIPLPSVRIYFLGIIGLFLGLGGVQYFLLEKNLHPPWVPFLFIFIDVCLLSYAALAQGPPTGFDLPPQMVLRGNQFIFFFIFLAGTALSYSPLLALWTGICAAAAWSVGVAWILSQPDTVTILGGKLSDIKSTNEFLALLLHPNFVNVMIWMKEVLLILLVSATLAVVVWRSKNLVKKQAISERQRGNLARYFSPNILDALAESDSPLLEVRQHNVTILFADIVEYTSLTESMPPEKAIAFLREYHSRMEEQVFSFGGTLDKFIGDAVMASFGAPKRGPQDATNAFECARGMLKSIAQWSQEREGNGEPAVRIGIGIHHGLAAMGDVGSERCAAFAVIGDTTNTTSRLQSLTRSLKSDVVVSQESVDALRHESKETPAALEGFTETGLQQIRGREQGITVWTFKMEKIIPTGEC